ncbi:MAG: methylated-DNA--[protein]-cysteine S-methyltransferase [Candidatus Marinimicrobia bacterium]|nr:methylated-DNA--[protein]-cysteine S-methyltransferase [Candidatus Neomarinimicrobiota bacterium]
MPEIFIVYTKLDTPVGAMFVASHAGGLCGLQFGQNAESFLQNYLRQTYPDAQVQRDDAANQQIVKQLQEYFSGNRRDFDLKLSPAGTPFQQKVWQFLTTIPFGKTVSYADVAAGVGNPKASRAVGGANGKNPIAVIIPCHRVIAADGTLGGYAGGLQYKRTLLNHECAPYKESGA